MLVVIIGAGLAAVVATVVCKSLLGIENASPMIGGAVGGAIGGGIASKFGGKK